MFSIGMKTISMQGKAPDYTVPHTQTTPKKNTQALVGRYISNSSWSKAALRKKTLFSYLVLAVPPDTQKRAEIRFDA